MQVAENEARLGHGKLAVELRALVDEAKNGRPPRPLDNVSTDRPHGGSSGLLETPYPRARLREMILSNPFAQQIERVIREQRDAERIIEQELVPRSKLLLVGPPGNRQDDDRVSAGGRTRARAAAGAARRLITNYMGETAARLRQVFDSTSRLRGVYLFDEFDAIGSQRGLTDYVRQATLIEKRSARSVTAGVSRNESRRQITRHRRSTESCSDEHGNRMLGRIRRRRAAPGAPQQRARTRTQGISHVEWGT